MKFTIDSNNKTIELEQLTFEEVFLLSDILKKMDGDNWNKYKIIGRVIGYQTTYNPGTTYTSPLTTTVYPISGSSGTITPGSFKQDFTTAGTSIIRNP